MKRIIAYAGCLVLIGSMLSMGGCARTKDLARMNRAQAATIISLNEEIQLLNEEIEHVSRAKDDLAQTKLELERQLQAEMAKGDLAVRMGQRGLVVTVLNKVLFDSGRTELKQTALSTLSKVGGILNTQVPDQMVYVEGHTDSDPIRHSNFKSNWELSTARATEVVHYFIDKVGVNPKRLMAAGYGQFQPVASNNSAQGKSMNRRVEIIISPHKFIKKSFS